MFHTIEINGDITVDLEVSPKHRLEKMCIRKGTQFSAQMKPYVVESPSGPVEVADLFFSDGTATRSVPFGYFCFVD